VYADVAVDLADEAPPPPRWFSEVIDELNDAAKDLTDAEVGRLARAYSFGTAGWLQKVEEPGPRDPADPRSILAHDCALIPAKVYRALNGLRHSHEEPGDWPADHDGSAKVALLSIDRSRVAWILAAERGLAPVPDVEPFVAELGILADQLERLFPRARAFVRPGFDNEQPTT
jgi:hypothetical protein